MAIQAHASQIGGGSEFSLIGNNGGIGINQPYVNNDHLYWQKDFNQHALFHQQSFLAASMEKQRQEIDLFIRTQNESLRYVLQEQRKQEMEMMVRKMEGNAMVLMAQKEEEMTKALRKHMELEDLLRRMETENQTWQMMARENEAMVATLSSTLEQVRERAAAACHDTPTAEDEGSCCGGGDSLPAKGSMMSSCRNCGCNGGTRVLFLPCRHLCCCTVCEAGLLVCPICNVPKKNRIEAFLFS